MNKKVDKKEEVYKKDKVMAIFAIVTTYLPLVIGLLSLNPILMIIGVGIIGAVFPEHLE